MLGEFSFSKYPMVKNICKVKFFLDQNVHILRIINVYKKYMWRFLYFANTKGYVWRKIVLKYTEFYIAYFRFSPRYFMFSLDLLVQAF